MVLNKLSSAFLLLIAINFSIVAEDTIEPISKHHHKFLYQQAFQEQLRMLNGGDSVDFKRAVFITENAFHEGTLNYQNFVAKIDEIANRLQKFIVQNEMTSYKTAGQWATFIYMTEPDEINNNAPYLYDFEDYFGENDFTKMFVTKLLNAKSGNCHSLPYLYKILCDELEAEVNLAITPNHVYIKHISEKGKWINIELTNASFPKDKDIIKESELTDVALQNQIYTKPLSGKESIAMTLFDLSNGYEVQFGTDSFFLAMVDTALNYFPNCIPLLMNKANYYADRVIAEQQNGASNQKLVNEGSINQKSIDQQLPFKMQQNYDVINRRILELGHQELSEKKYRKWLKWVEKEQKKEAKKN